MGEYQAAPRCAARPRPVWDTGRGASSRRGVRSSGGVYRSGTAAPPLPDRTSSGPCPACPGRGILATGRGTATHPEIGISPPDLRRHGRVAGRGATTPAPENPRSGGRGVSPGMPLTRLRAGRRRSRPLSGVLYASTGAAYVKQPPGGTRQPRRRPSGSRGSAPPTPPRGPPRCARSARGTSRPCPVAGTASITLRPEADGRADVMPPGGQVGHGGVGVLEIAVAGSRRTPVAPVPSRVSAPPLGGGYPHLV
jgi:hypothetical protein